MGLLPHSPNQKLVRFILIVEMRDRDMRAARTYRPVFSLSWFLVVLLVIPLLVLLLIFLIQPLSSSSSSSTATWIVDNSSTSGNFSYSLALTAAQEWPQPPAEAPLTSFLYGSPSPAPAPHQITTGAIQVGGSRRVKSWRSMKLDKLEASLGKARSSIREAAGTSLARLRNKINSTSKTVQLVHDDDPDYVPHGRIYRNAHAFHRSYLLMEKLFKIYVYEEGEVPLFHNGPCKSIYSSEGRFIHEMEMGKLYRTKDLDEAHVYFIPVSVANLVQYLYVPDSKDLDPMKRAIVDYVKVIADRHPFWNRSLGADHFMLSCHDWGPMTSSFVPNLFHKSIRVLCNANTSEGFNPSKDASFPEINLLTGEISRLGGQPPSTRTVLAFFAGHLHGHIRYLLLNEWKGKDQDVQVYEALPKQVSYEKKLKSSKFCLCPSGYEVASPRVVEAIYAECVPVLISDTYVPPFSDVLNWKSFSVQIDVKNISDIKNILMGISHRQYLRMQRNVKQVQRHFVVNGPPRRYDVFHMIVHSIWLRRLNIRVHDFQNQ
ncbi:putative glycosyltransferase [Rosa sericea]